MKELCKSTGTVPVNCLLRVLFILLGLSILSFIALVIVHNIIFSRVDYDQYASDYFLVYDDISEKYPREEFKIRSGNNNLSAFLYGKENSKGIIVIAPGHKDANDIKLYEVRYFVDAGYSVIGFDYTGCYTSEGTSMVGYTQSVYDLDALLKYIENSDQFSATPIFLFGHSLGGYAVAAELKFDHDIKAAVVASGFDTPGEQWQYSIKKYTGFAYPIIKPLNALFIHLKYGADKDLSAVEGINSVDIPVFVFGGEEDTFYGGGSPIYNQRDAITNPNFRFMLMDKENHNGHYDYFLTDEALRYQASKPVKNIDKELYMEHDEGFMKQIVEFFDSCKTYEAGF